VVEKKPTGISPVMANEEEIAQTESVVSLGIIEMWFESVVLTANPSKPSLMERSATEGDSPVGFYG